MLIPFSCSQSIVFVQLTCFLRDFEYFIPIFFSFITAVKKYAVRPINKIFFFFFSRKILEVAFYVCNFIVMSLFLEILLDFCGSSLWILCLSLVLVVFNTSHIIFFLSIVHIPLFWSSPLEFEVNLSLCWLPFVIFTQTRATSWEITSI